MTGLPRFPPAVEHRVLKIACGLPPRLQRLFFGAPPQLEGRMLAPDIHALISIAARARSDSLDERAEPAEARVQRRAEAAIVAERPTIPMARVEQIAIPGPGGELAARLYVPVSDSPDPPPLLVYSTAAAG